MIDDPEERARLRERIHRAREKFEEAERAFLEAEAEKQWIKAVGERERQKHQTVLREIELRERMAEVGVCRSARLMLALALERLRWYCY